MRSGHRVEAATQASPYTLNVARDGIRVKPSMFTQETAEDPLRPSPVVSGRLVIVRALERDSGLLVPLIVVMNGAIHEMKT